MSDDPNRKVAGSFSTTGRSTTRASSPTAPSPTDPESPEAHTLVGAVASAEGDFDGALEAFERAMELDDQYLDPILLAAETHALEGDAPEALRLVERALDVAEEEDEYVDAVLLKAEIELGDDDPEAAEATLRELPPVALPSAALELRAGDAFLEIEESRLRRRALCAAATAEPDNADAAYGLGLVAEARGEQAEMVTHFQRVRALDVEAPRAPWAVTTERLEELVEAALAELPERAQKLLENVPVMVEDYPSEEVVADGFDPRGLGLFAGVPFPEQSALCGAAAPRGGLPVSAQHRAGGPLDGRGGGGDPHHPAPRDRPLLWPGRRGPGRVGARLRRHTLVTLRNASAATPLLLALLWLGCSNPGKPYHYPLDTVLRLDHVQAKGTHNSYHVESTDIPEWEYTHAAARRAARPRRRAPD